MTLWPVFMAAYFGDVLEEFRDRWREDTVLRIARAVELTSPS